MDKCYLLSLNSFVLLLFFAHIVELLIVRGHVLLNFLSYFHKAQSRSFDRERFYKIIGKSLVFSLDFDLCVL